MSKSHSLFGICGGNVYAFQSVIGTGTLQLVDDIEENWTECFDEANDATFRMEL